MPRRLPADPRDWTREELRAEHARLQAQVDTLVDTCADLQNENAALSESLAVLNDPETMAALLDALSEGDSG